MADINSIEQVLKDINSTLNNITSNSNGVSGNSTQNIIDYTILLNDIVSSNNSMKNNVSYIRGIIPHMEGHLKDTVNYLKLIEGHISGGINSGNNTKNPQNTTGNTNFTNIETTVKDILTEIKGFRSDFNKGANPTNGLPQNIADVFSYNRNKRQERQNKFEILEEAERILNKNGSNGLSTNDISMLNLAGINTKDLEKTNNAEEQLKIIEKLILDNTKEEEDFKKKYERNSKRRGWERDKQNFKNWKNENLNGYNIATLATKGITALGKGNLKSSELIDQGISKISQISPLAGAIASAIKMGFDSYAKQSELGSQYARTVGGGKFGMNEFIQREANFVDRNSKLNNNYKPDEVFSALTGYAEATGRNGIHQTDANVKSMIDLKRMGIESDTLNMFDTFGKSANEVDSYFTKLYSESGKRGLSFKNVSKAVKDNLKMAQTYTFASGVKGLMRMAETSTQLKFNMNEVAKMAEKVSTLEGVMKAGAGLSVLGGEFANFANPMQMMYEGLNDMEGLQKRMVNMFGDMAYFDKDKQEITIGAFDKQRMKAAAEAMGVDYNEMLSLAMNNQRGKIVESQLGGGLDEVTANYIKNIAQIDERGKAYVSDANGEKKYLEGGNFTEQDKAFFKAESEKKDMGENAKIGDVYNSTRDMYDKLDQILNFLSTKLGAWVAKIAGATTWGTGDEGDAREAYWKANKSKLIEQAGNKQAARRAAKMGMYDHLIFEYDNDGNILRDNEGKIKTIQQKANGENYIYGKPHQLGGELRNVEGGEAILNRTAVNGLGVRNIAKFNSGNFTPISNIGNALNTMKVAPTYTASAAPQKLSFEPMNINLNGKFELTSNGKNKSINLDDLDKNELKKLVMDIVKSSTPQINKQLMTLRDKGYNMEKDPFRGSGGYA